jgi:hypothetical protein
MKKNSTRDSKVNSKDKRKSYENQNEELGESSYADTFKDLYSDMKRNKPKYLIIFSILTFAFLVLYFQWKYDQQQRFSPDKNKDDPDVHLKINILG